MGIRVIINGAIFHLLSRRQLEILDLVVRKEYDVYQLAKALGVSVRTVHFHRAKIEEKYDTNNWEIVLVKYIKERYQIIPDVAIEDVLDKEKVS